VVNGEPKTKSIRIIFEGICINVIAHAVGGFYLAPVIAKVFNDVPSLTISLLSSAAFSPFAAIIYIAIRLRIIPSFKANKNTFVYIIAGIAVALLLRHLITSISGSKYKFVLEVLQTPYPYIYINLFILLIWTPVVEEILFRGYFFEILENKWGLLIALISSSIIFALIHGLWGVLWLEGLTVGIIISFLLWLFFIFLGSLLLTAIYIKGGLIAAIMVHVFMNSYLLYLNS
jgi:membrane protease YdiL (CAAX protease family)